MTSFRCLFSLLYVLLIVRFPYQIPWVHPYWKQFDIPSLPDYYHFLVGMYMTFVCPLGVVGNFCVIYIFLK